jgi:hypothetical protein
VKSANLEDIGYNRIEKYYHEDSLDFSSVGNFVNFQGFGRTDHESLSKTVFNKGGISVSLNLNHNIQEIPKSFISWISSPLLDLIGKTEFAISHNKEIKSCILIK